MNDANKKSISRYSHETIVQLIKTKCCTDVSNPTEQSSSLSQTLSILTFINNIKCITPELMLTTRPNSPVHYYNLLVYYLSLISSVLRTN